MCSWRCYFLLLPLQLLLYLFFGCRITFFFIPLHLNAIYTQEVYSPGKSYLLWRRSPSVAFIVVNGNLCIEFYEAIFKCWSVYCLLVCTSMSAVLFVAMNFSSNFSAEKILSSEFAAQQNCNMRCCLCTHVCADC